MSDDQYKDMKMYILVKDWVPAEKVPVICAHASLACYVRMYEGMTEEITENFDNWLTHSYKKVVCSVNESEFIKASEEATNCTFIEESSLGDAEVAVVFVPRLEYPKMFKFFKLWRP